MEDSKLIEKLQMLDYLAEKRNELLKEKHMCLKHEVSQLKDLFTVMKPHGDYKGIAQSLEEAEDRLERNAYDVCNGRRSLSKEDYYGDYNGNWGEEDLSWVKEKTKEMEESLCVFQQAHQQVIEENELMMDEQEATKLYTPGNGSPKQTVKSPKDEDKQVIVVDAVSMVNELKNALQQSEPLKKMLESAREHFNAAMDNLHLRIKSLEHEQCKSSSYEVQLKDTLETVSRLSEENEALKRELKSTTAKYLNAEKQLLESYDSIRELKNTINDSTSHFRSSMHEGCERTLEEACVKLEGESRGQLVNHNLVLKRGYLQKKLQDAMRTITKLKASRNTLQEALKESEPMKAMYKAANEELRFIIEQLTSRICELENNNRSDKHKTFKTFKDTLMDIEKVNSKLRRFKDNSDPRADVNIISMITLINSRLCVLEQSLIDQDSRRETVKAKPEQSTKQQCQHCLKNIDNAVSRAHEEYKLLCSEVAEMQSKKEHAAATLKSVEERISEKRKAIDDSQLSVEKALSGLQIELKRPHSDNKLTFEETSSMKCKAKEEERHLSGHGLVWEFSQNTRRVKRRSYCKKFLDNPQCVDEKHTA